MAFSRISKPLAVSIALLMLSVPACAKKPESGEAVVKAMFQKNFPNRQIKSFKPTPVKGMYEVAFVDGSLVYADASGKYLFVGDLVNIEERRSVTEARIREIFKVDFAKLPFEKAFKVVKGNGSRQMAVFTDPDCPYCKMLDREVISKMDNITVHYFLMPLPQLHPNAPDIAARVWCAEDRAKTWYAYTLEGITPSNEGNCPNPMQDIVKLAQSMRIQGTPGLVFSNGEVVPGMLDLERLEAKLNDIARNK